MERYSAKEMKYDSLSEGKTKKIQMKKILMVALMLSVGLISQAQQAITLGRAMDIAFKNSPDIRLSELSLKRSQSNLDAQRAGLKSLFKLNVDPVNYNKSKRFDSFNSKWYNNENFVSSTGFRIDQPLLPTGGSLFLDNNLYWQYNNREILNKNTGVYEPNITRQFYNGLRVGFDQPIFTHNQLQFDLRAIELDYENSLISYLLKKLSLERIVAISFYDVYEKQMSLDIAKTELENNEKNYEIISNKVEGGLEALEELYQAEVNLASSKSSYYNQKVSLENAKDKFRTDIGMDLDEEFLALTSVELTPVMMEVKHSVEYALTNRMELRQREISIEQSKYSLIQTKNSVNDFNGSISGSFGITGENEKFNSVYEYPTNEPRFSISLNIPLFDWGKRRNKIEAAQASIAMSEINFEQEKRDIIINVRQVYRSLENIKNQIEIAELNVKNAQLTYDINQERYNNGDITGMDLNLYQNQLSNKKMSLTNELIDYKIELLNLKLQTLYDFEKNESIVPEEINGK